MSAGALAHETYEDTYWSLWEGSAEMVSLSFGGGVGVGVGARAYFGAAPLEGFYSGGALELAYTEFDYTLRSWSSYSERYQYYDYSSPLWIFAAIGEIGYRFVLGDFVLGLGAGLGFQLDAREPLFVPTGELAVELGWAF